MTTIFEDKVEVLAGSEGLLQSWQGDQLAVRVTAGGNLRTGDDLERGSSNAALEIVTEVLLPGEAVRQGMQAHGIVRGEILEALAWIVQELELFGTEGVSGLHTALRTRIVQGNTGDASGAEVRAADVIASNQGGSLVIPVGQAKGLVAAVRNEADAYLSKAIGVEAAILNSQDSSISEAAGVEVATPQNAGTITTLYGVRVRDLEQGTTNYALHTGKGQVKLGNGLHIDAQDNVGVGTSSPTAKLDIASDTFRLRTSRTPASATASGSPGELCWDANYLYVCVAANTWKRTALSTW